MKIYLHELKEEPQYYHFTEKDEWLTNLLKDVQESTLKEAFSQKVNLELKKLQDVVFLKGQSDLHLGLLCSRCANPFHFHLVQPFQSLFTKNNQWNSVASGQHTLETSFQSEDSGLEMDFLEKDYIVVDDVLKEQIYLGIPFQPLCQKECKGICPTCGQDQNIQQCQCHRIRNSVLAQALKKIRI